MSGFLGKDGFAWFFGVVEDRMDPLEIGRVRVRVFGYHDADRNILPTGNLPWATVIQPATSANFSGKGFSSVGLIEGSWVFGFFADPNSYQVPVILGSISGLNAATLKDLNEGYGSGFKDPRTPEEIANYPTDELERDYPQGQGIRGDIHGAQLSSTPKSKPYPSILYASGANKKPAGTPDTNILALNDEKRINQTIVDLKTRTRSEGGLRDENIPVADIFFPKFATGVLNATFVNLGTVKLLGIPPNIVLSSSLSSMKATSNNFKANPTDANGKRIHTGLSPRAMLQSLTKSPPFYTNVINLGKQTMNTITTSFNTALAFPGDVASEAVSGFFGTTSTTTSTSSTAQTGKI
jgi:hypothetical protein